MTEAAGRVSGARRRHRTSACSATSATVNRTLYSRAPAENSCRKCPHYASLFARRRVVGARIASVLKIGSSVVVTVTVTVTAVTQFGSTRNSMTIDSRRESSGRGPLVEEQKAPIVETAGKVEPYRSTAESRSTRFELWPGQGFPSAAPAFPTFAERTRAAWRIRGKISHTEAKEGKASRTRSDLTRFLRLNRSLTPSRSIGRRRRACHD